MSKSSVETRVDAAPLPHAVWNRIASSPHRLLMLDYDGTLVPLCADRRRAMLDSRVRDALEAVVALGDPVVIISGRPMFQLAAFLDGLNVSMVGEHGWEERTIDGQLMIHPLPEPAAAGLRLAHRAAVAAGLEPDLEAKRASIVLHTRGLEPAAARELEARGRQVWAHEFEHDGLKLEDIDGGLELRAAARGKGIAAWELFEREPQGTLPIYLGDDLSDEQAIQILRPVGVTIRVGRPHLPSAAEWHFQSPDEVAGFLVQWKHTIPARGHGTDSHA